MNIDQWTKIYLSEVYEYRSGLSKSRDCFGSGYGFLSFKDVFYNYFVPEKLTELVQSSDKEQEACSIQKGDVFLTRTSETLNELGMSAVALRDYKGSTFNGFCKRLRPKSSGIIYPEYAAFYFRSPEFRKEIKSLVSMSTRASLNHEMMNRLKITVPPWKEQVLIGNSLKLLHDKIELNRQMNQTLEEMAQAIFKSWFVDFDGHDDLVESELGLIPKGWKVESLANCGSFLNGIAIKKYMSNEDDKTYLPAIKIREMRSGFDEKSDHVSSEVPLKYIINNGDILFSWSGSLLVMIWTGGVGVLNQHIFKVESSIFPRWFIYLWTKYHLTRFQQIAESKATTMGHIKRGHLKEAKVVVPPINVINALSKTFEPLLERFELNEAQNQTLTELRDTLLPKLISGELRVPEAIEITDDVMTPQDLPTQLDLLS